MILPNLQAFCFTTFYRDNCIVRCACLQIPQLEIVSIFITGQLPHSELSATNEAVAALMDGRRRVGNVQAGLCSFKNREQDGQSPVAVNWNISGQPGQCTPTEELQAVQPLPSQFQHIELHVMYSELFPEASALAEAIGATTKQLRLVLHMYSACFNQGNLTTVSGWLELLDALPHVETVQVTFEQCYTEPFRHGCFPVFREPWMLARFKPAVEQVMSSAIGACEQKGR
jgi:hypothetical protein